MRIVFTCWAWPSHLYAMVPLAWACRAAGHDVRVASQPALAPAIAASGLTGVAVGRDFDAVSAVREYTTSVARPDGKAPRALRMFHDLADAMLDGLLEFGRGWRPDLVVFDPTAWAGPVAAAALGVPAVRHLYGLDLLSRAGDALAGQLAPLAERAGAGPVDPFGVLTLDPCPAAVQVPTVRGRVPVRYVPHNGPGTPAPPWPATGRPRICVTWGTTMARLGAGFFRAGDVARALGELGASVTVAVTGAQLPLLGDLPDDVRVLVDTPLHTVLPGCDLLVTHGGAGTMLTGLAAGVPQVAVPRLPDHAAHARQLAAVGAGIAFGRDETPGPDRIREAAGRALDPAFAARAGELAAELAARRSPASVVTLLEEHALTPAS
ncbi:nucleotide disphospho-sugar-binding domain-containing protein [Amycolatopsis sp. NPDC021455]|uniref:nucleotide disphospho-sugar-binding domain-containing protein n=1 Tax=Amycolatopsis sp. NPDC021455 TaxID=3154901 RepID=UPI0033F74F44